MFRTTSIAAPADYSFRQVHTVLELAQRKSSEGQEARARVIRSNSSGTISRRTTSNAAGSSIDAASGPERSSRLIQRCGPPRCRESRFISTSGVGKNPKEYLRTVSSIARTAKLNNLAQNNCASLCDLRPRFGSERNLYPNAY